MFLLFLVGRNWSDTSNKQTTIFWMKWIEAENFHFVFGICLIFFVSLILSFSFQQLFPILTETWESLNEIIHKVREIEIKQKALIETQNGWHWKLKIEKELFAQRSYFELFSLTTFKWIMEVTCLNPSAEVAFLLLTQWHWI